jgi:hypothetical protein
MGAAMRTRLRLIPVARVRRLANQVHELGASSLSYLFDELLTGADPLERIEAFARLSPLADFIEANGGGHRSPPFLIRSEDSHD